MKTALVILLLISNAYAQSTEITDIFAGNVQPKHYLFDFLDVSTKDTSTVIGKSAVPDTKYYNQPNEFPEGFNEKYGSVQNVSNFPYSFGIGPSFVIEFDNSFGDPFGSLLTQKTGVGYNIYLNGGKKFGDNFMLTGEINFTHNSFSSEYNFGYYDGTHEIYDYSLSRFNILYNSKFGVFSSYKYMFCAFIGTGVGLIFGTEQETGAYNYKYSHNSICIPIDFGISGGLKISNTFFLNCDLVFDYPVVSSNGFQNLYLTPRFGFTYVQ